MAHAPDVTPDMLDPDTPDSVYIRAEARRPVTDPTLGIPVPLPTGPTPKNRLVTLGDSLTHGFQSMAIYNTQISYPAIIASEMGLQPQKDFRYPVYRGYGGLPMNIEFLIRDLEARYGNQVNWWEVIPAGFTARHHVAQVEAWWQQNWNVGVGSTGGINHNLAVWGYDLRDALGRTAELCAANIQARKDYFKTANDRSGWRVLESARDSSGQALTQFGGALELSRQGSMEQPGVGEGIETLIVFLGANNALGSVVQMEVKWSKTSVPNQKTGGPAYQDLDLKGNFTVWDPEHFEVELDHVLDQVKQIKARHVIWATVPHVTIAPLAKGLPPGGTQKTRRGSRYFDYYAYAWVDPAKFHPNEDKHLTAPQARAVDSAIDQYNDAIVERVRRARLEGRNWYVLDVAGMLDRLASRRYIDDLDARPDWWTPYPMPLALQPLNLNSYFFESGPTGRTKGGLFALDGVHPTTVGYGLLAQEFINIMQLAGVKFYCGDGKTERPGPVQVDFQRLIALDTLISAPPKSLTSDLGLLAWLQEHVDDLFALMGKQPPI